ncbi:MAG: BACON domain-containing protein [Desulfobulbaceae bacterium]
MKTKNSSTSVVRTLLILILAGIGFTFGPAQAATMASFTALPSLDAQVDKPTGVAVDGAGRVYVAEAMNNRVLIFAQGGSLLATIPGLAKPISVAVDAAGRIYVGSAWQGSVTVFDSARKELFKLGTGDNEFIEPCDIDIDGSGQAYVTDKDNNTVRVYNTAGQFVRSIGTPGSGNGQLWHPCSLAIDPVSSELVVLDRQQFMDNYAKTMIDGARIQFFSMDGSFKRGYAKFGYDMNAGQLVMPVSVTVDSANRVYVSDARLQKVMVYDNANALLGMIDNSAAPLRTPLGLAMAASGRLYVSALLSGRVDSYGIGSYAAMGVQPASLSFTATAGENAPAPQDMVISNSGKSDISWSAAVDKDWLSLPATGGVLQPNASSPFAISVRHDGLAPGTYQGSVRISAPGMEEVVAVTLTVKPNPLQVSPASLSFTANEGTTPAAQTLSVVTGGSEQVNWSASADKGWLFLPKTTGSGSATVKVYADASRLGVGSHNGTITFLNLAGGSVGVAVRLTISEASEPPTATPRLPQPGAGEVAAGGKNWRVDQVAAGVTLRGIWASGARDLLAVGDGGTILGYNGRGWRAMASGSESALQSIWGSVTESSYDAYAVGEGGTALHFDGTVWTGLSTGTSESLADVWGAAEVLAVGGYGTILNLTQSAAGSANLVLRSLWGSSANDIFAVGETILHSDGTTWTAMAPDTSQWLNAVWGSSTTDVFAVGEYGTIIHYDGANWTAMESGVQETLHGVYGDAPNNVYAVGDNAVVLHYDGTTWNLLLAGGISLRDVWAAARLVVAVGDDGTILTGRSNNAKEPGKRPKAALTGQQEPAREGKARSGGSLQSPSLKGPRQTR